MTLHFSAHLLESSHLQFCFFPAHTPISHASLLLPPFLQDFKLLLARFPVASTLLWPMVTFLSGAYSQLAAIFDIIDCSLFFRNITYLYLTYTKVWHYSYLAFLLSVCLLFCLPSWVLQRSSLLGPLPLMHCCPLWLSCPFPQLKHPLALAPLQAPSSSIQLCPWIPQR